MSKHWVCTKCWGPVHEEKNIGGILPACCAACGEQLLLRESHVVLDEEFAEILARLDKPTPPPAERS